MGIGLGSKRCALDTCAYSYVPPDYEVRKRICFNGHTIMKVWYRRATNCGGEKILVMEGYIEDKSCAEDPHFADDEGPVARFHPSQAGWENAIKFVETL